VGGSEAADLVTRQPVLYHIEISHYNEKARWALDYKGVPHRRKAPPPMMHMAWAAWLTRGRQKTFPVLVLDGERIGDSTRIIEALERRFPEPPLYPQAPGDRQRALELEDFFDEQLGPHIRRVVFHSVTRDSTAFAEAAAPKAGRAVQAGFRLSAPLTAPLLRLRYGIDDASAETGRAKVLAAVERVEAELGPGGYLVGGRFSVADLTAASLLYPLALPDEFLYRPAHDLPETGVPASSGCARCGAGTAASRPPCGTDPVATARGCGRP
jgi:glutathione S-transferase